MGWMRVNARPAGKVSLESGGPFVFVACRSQPSPVYGLVRGRDGVIVAAVPGRMGRERRMFERFTDRARRGVGFAQEEARVLNHNYIGTWHILLGLIHEGEGVAAKALESLGISLEAVRQQGEGIIGPGHQAPSGQLP